MIETIRFLRQFLAPRPDAVVREETTYPRGDGSLPATLYRPRGAVAGSGLPGWVALHGLTTRGREHPSLEQFARALSASGAVVLVPELPDWQALDVAPESTARTIGAAVLALDESAWTTPGRVGVIGFSFGATQSLVASTDPALHGHLAGVAAWGGYADIERSLLFGFLGEHRLDGETHHLDPDPYGRWILTGNYLHLLPEFAEDRALGDAILSLAREAGRRGIMSWLPETDPIKARLREPLTPRQKEVFDLIAPAAAHDYTEEEKERITRLVARMSRAAAEAEPLLDPSPHLARVSVPVFLAHGRGDRLIPWTELPRLERALPAGRVRYAGITGLFAHSFGERWLPTPGAILDAARFVRLINRMLRLI